MEINKIYQGNCLELAKQLEPNSLDLVFFSPPYFDVHQYTDNDPNEIGFGQTYEKYIESLTELLDELREKIKPTGNIVINVMDLVRKNQPFLISNDLIDWIGKDHSGYYKFIERIIWHIPNKMPVASEIRFCNKFEWILHWAKDPKSYYFDKDPVREPHSHYAETDKRKWKWNSKGKCPGNMWSIPAYRVAGKNKFHIAGFPEELVRRILLSYCPENGLVLDPFMGSGTTAVTAKKYKRNYLGFELNPDYVRVAEQRLK